MEIRVFVDASGGEVFITNGRKEAFGLAQSLLTFIDLDIWARFGALCEEMGTAAVSLRRGENVAENAAFIRRGLGELADAHIYFECLKSERNERLPAKWLTHIPADMAALQDSINGLIKSAFDLALETPEKERLSALERFPFEPLTTAFERVEGTDGTPGFAEVLRPKSIAEIVTFILRECVRRGQRFKTCKLCGRYFAVYGYANTEYCARLFRDTGKTCKDLGAVRTFQNKAADNPVIALFNRAYKRQFARIRYGKISKAEFQVWAEEARVLRDRVIGGEVPLAEFDRWLEG